MAFDTFLYLDSVKGESQDSKFTAWIEISSFSMGATNPATIGSATGGSGGGKVSLSPIHVQKQTDSASPQLFQMCCTGQHFKTANFCMRKASGGASALVYYQYDLQEVYIESIQWSGSSGGTDTPTESVSLTYGAINVTYTPQKVDGTAGSAVIAGWDVKANAKL
jgi:type VI secretion system secreted protein Hcp